MTFSNRSAPVICSYHVPSRCKMLNVIMCICMCMYMFVYIYTPWVSIVPPLPTACGGGSGGGGAGRGGMVLISNSSANSFEPAILGVRSRLLSISLS